MSTLADNRSQVPCEIKEAKHQRWQTAVRSSARNPPFGIGFNASANDTSFSSRPFNISQFPFHQQCTEHTKGENRKNHTHCSTNINFNCQLLPDYRKNLTCPFDTVGHTCEECECVGLKKNVSAMKIYDQVNCTCMHDNTRGTMTNNGNCNSNYVFTKECIIDQVKTSSANSLRLNCTFLNCSSTLENEFFNETAKTYIYESCMDNRPVRIIPDILEKRTTTTTTTTTSTATTKKATSPSINNTTNSTTPKANSTPAKVTELSQSTSAKSKATKSASRSTRDVTKRSSPSSTNLTTTQKPTTPSTTVSTSSTTTKPPTSTARITQKPPTTTAETTAPTTTTETTAATKATTTKPSTRVTSTGVRTTSAKANTPDETRTLAVPEKSDSTSLSISTLQEHISSSRPTTLHVLPHIEAQQSEQMSSGSIAGIAIFAILVCSALGFTGFLVKTRKGQQLRKRLSKRFAQE